MKKKDERECKIVGIRRLWIKISSKWRILLVTFIPVIMFFSLVSMLSPSSVTMNSGRADLLGMDFSNNKLVALNGQWEFYWNKLLTPED